MSCDRPTSDTAIKLLPKWAERDGKVHFTPGRDTHGHFVGEKLIARPCPHSCWPRIEFDLYVHRQYLAAEESTRGHMLNAAGRAHGIDPMDFFRGGHRPSVERWGSDELRAWFGSAHVAASGDGGGSVLTFTEFRQQLVAA